MEKVLEECNLSDLTCREAFVISDEGKQLYSQFVEYVANHDEMLSSVEIAIAEDSPNVEQALASQFMSQLALITIIEMLPWDNIYN